MKTTTRTPKNTKHQSTAHSQRLALESRMVFDGAIAATAVDVQADVIDKPATVTTSEAAPPPSEPHVDFTADKTAVAVDFQPSPQDQNSHPAFPVEPSPLNVPDLPLAPVAGVSGSYASVLLVVDPRADNASALLAHPPANTQILTLDTTRDGFQQVADLMQGRHDISQLNILPWADGNNQWLGNKALTNSLDPATSAELMHWGDGLANDAHIVFHSPNNLGSSLIDYVDALTGANASWSSDTRLAAQPHELIVVDTNIANYQTLINEINPNAEVLLIDANQDGISQLVNDLHGRTDISALHILSHGHQGELILGTTQLNSSNIDNYQSQFAEIGRSLTTNGDILLYGCDVANGTAGIAFVNHLADLTKADIAASNDTTGNAALGGDWTLEYNTGTIEARSLAAVNYDGELAGSVVFNSATASVGAVEQQLGITTINATGGIHALSYSISGGADAAQFIIDSATGHLSFSNPHTIAAPTDAGLNNVYDVQITASDGVTSATQSLAVTVAVPNPNTAGFGVAAGTQTFFVPGTAEQMWFLLKQMQSDKSPDLSLATYTSKGLHSVVTVAATANNTVVYYDQWEDGYDATSGAPAGAATSSTVVMNGQTITKTTYAGSSTVAYTLNAGQSIQLETKSTPINHRTVSAYDPAGLNIKNTAGETIYDGGDRLFVTGGPVTTDFAMWPEAIGTVFAMAWEIYPAKPDNTSYTIPIGENMGVTSFQTVDVVVQATADNTVVGFDTNGDGVFDTVIDTDLNGTPDAYQVTLNKGQSIELSHVNVGTKVISTNPTQVLMVTGSNADYESRAYSLTPSTLWSNDYYSPIDGGATIPTDLYLYNPNATAITVRYDEVGGVNTPILGSDGKTYTTDGFFTIAAHSTVKYSTLVGHTVPNNSAVHLFTTNAAEKFWGVGTVDSGAGINWGFSLIPSYVLNTDYTFGWAPQWDFNNKPANTASLQGGQGSGIFVTPVNDNTTVYIDYNRDGVVDKTITLNRLQNYVIYDPTDNDLTGTHIWATDKIAAAWGENPDKSQFGLPFLDMGYTALPLPPSWLDVAYGVIKTSNIDTLAPSGVAQTVTYTLQIPAYQALLGLAVSDKLAAGWNYIDGSTVITLPDGSSLTGAATNPVLGTVAGRETMLWDTPQLPTNIDANSMVTVRYSATTSVNVAPGPNENDVTVTATPVSIGTSMTATDSKFVDVGATIGDIIFNDLNNNNILDAGEVGIAGAVVELRRQSDNALIATATTDSNGRFLFTGLDDSPTTTSAGVFKLVVLDGSGTALAAYTVSTGGSNTVANISLNDDTHAGQNFAYHTPSISGQTRLDTNNNGVIDSGEPGLAGVTVNLYLDTNANGVLDAADTLVASKVTDGNGAYSFSGVVTGNNYLVVEQNLTGYTSTVDKDGNAFTNGLDTIAIKPLAGDSANNNFADYITPPPSASITKALISTSNARTGIIDGNNVSTIDLANGETVTYELVVTVPDGRSVANLTVSDLLPTTVNGASLTYSSAVIKAIGSNVLGSTLAVGASPTSVSGQNISFNFGNNVSTNPTDGAITDADKIVIWVTATAGTAPVASTVTPTQLWTLDELNSAGQTYLSTSSAITNAISGGQAAQSGALRITAQVPGQIGTGLAMYNAGDSAGAAEGSHTSILTNTTATALGIDPTNTFTMSVWFNTTVARSGVLFAEATGINANQIETGLVIDATGHVQAGIGGNISAATTAAYNDGAWHMATLVKDTTGATHTANDSHLYIYSAAGVLQQQIDFTSGSTTQNTNVAMGGVANNNAAADYDGILDNATIFTSALTQAQVSALAATPKPLHQWNMDFVTATAPAPNFVDLGSAPLAAALGVGTLFNKNATIVASHVSTDGSAELMTGNNGDTAAAEASQSYISLAPNVAGSTGLGVDVTNSYTQTVWFNTTTARGLILGEVGNTSNLATMESGIYIDASGHLVANIGGNAVTSTNTNYTDGNWYMVGLVKDTAGVTHTANDSHLYIYNSTGTQLEVLNFTSGSAAQAASLTIGGTSNATGVAALDFDGTVDDVRIYGSALSGNQIADIARNSVTTLIGGSTQSLTNTANVQSGAFTDGTSTAAVEVLTTTPTNRGSISGQVQIDGNSNGLMDDAATTHLGGFTVTLKDSGGTIITTRQTAYDGSYEFGGLATGSTYRIEITPPANYIGITDFDGSGTLNQITTVSLTDNAFITGQNFLIGQPKPTVDLDTTAAGTGHTGNFVFGGGAVPITLQNAAADLGADIAENPIVTQLNQLTVTLTNRPDGSAESLSIGSLPAGIVVLTPYDPLTGTLVLSGTATLATYETALEAIRYNNTSTKAALDPTARVLNVQVRDVNGQSSNVAVTTLNIVDLQPVANPDSYTVAEDSGTTPLSVLNNDITGDGASSIIAVTTPKDANGVAVGTAVINGTQINFTPNANYNGAASFQYTITDTNGDISTNTVNLTVTPVNDVPVGSADIATTPEDLPVIINILSNDSSADGWATPNAITGKTNGANGTVTINVDGTVTYTPNTGFVGDDNFTYTITDFNGDSVPVAVTVHVTPNINPVAVPDSTTTPAGRTINIDVLGNDTQGDSPTVVTAVGSPAHGTTSINPDGTIKYISNGLFAGNDTFTYTITDKNGSTSSAVVTVAVTNSAPVANADVYVLNALSTGETLIIPAASNGLIGNDFDADGTAGLTVKNYTNGITAVLPGTVLTTTQGGTVTVNADGTLSYTRPAGFKGIDSFNYTLTDPTGATATAPVTIIVTENHDPVARNDSYTTNVNQNLITIPGTGVIQKAVADSDVDVGDVLTVVAYDSNTANGGIVSMSPDGSFTYTPAVDFVGTDTFQYQISDGNGGTSIATVSIDVLATPPVAVNDVAIVQSAPGSSVTFSIVANDQPSPGEPIVSVTINSLPLAAQGTLYLPNGTTPVTSGQILTAAQAASLVFKPSGTYVGDSTFTYTALDSMGDTSNPATVTIHVVSGNAVLAVNDTANTDQGQAVQITLTTNDTGLPNPLNLNSIVITTPPPVGEGTVSVDGNGKVTFTPTSTFHGVSTFSYTVTDSVGTVSNPATVNVTVNGDVIALDDNYPSVPKNSIQTILPVLNNDSDPENDSFSIISVTSPGHGVVEINNASNVVLYTPTTGYEGTDTFTYTILDSHGNTKTATVTLTVAAHGNSPTVDLDKTDKTTAIGSSDYVTKFAVGGVGASGTIGTPVAVTDTLTQITDDDSPLMSGAVIKITNMQNVGNEILSIASIPGIGATYNALTGEMILTGTATKQFYETALASLTYNNTSATPETNVVRDISVQLTDTSGNTSNVAHSFISLYAPPFVDLDGNNSSGVTGTGFSNTFIAGEDVNINIADTDAIVSDVDDPSRLAGQTKTMVVTLTIRPDGANESLTVDNAVLAAHGLTSSYNPATGELTLTSTVPATLRLPADYQAALATIRYNNTTPSATIDVSDRIITVVAVGGADLFSNIATATIHIDATKPTVSTSPGSTPFVEAKDVPSTPVVIDNTVTVIEREHLALPSATVSITGNYVSGEDILAFTNDGSTMGNITASYSNGVLSLVSAGDTATPAQWQAALRSVTYLNNSDTPNTNARTISFQIYDGIFNSDITTKTVTVTATNDTPSYQLLAPGAAINYTEKGSPVTFSSTVGIYDPELSSLAGGAGNFNGSTLTVSRNGGANNQDIFSSTGTLSPLNEGGNLVLAGITVGTVTQNSGGTLILSFSNNATQAQVDSVLQQLAYSNSSSTPPASVIMNGVFNDSNTAANEQGLGGALFTSGSITINITPVNDLPVANADVGAVNENATLTITAANGVILSGSVPTGVDTDSDSPTLTVIGVTTGTAANTAAVGTANVASSLLGTYGHLTLASDGSYVYTADTAAADALGQGITATDVFSYAISDGNGGTAFTTLTITVTGTNDVPTVSGILPPVTQADSTAVNVPTVAGFTDLDSNNVFTYTASGLPTGLTINPATGAITGTLANNASQGGTAGVYSIVVTATDSQGIPVSQTFSFTATNPAPTANPDVNAVAENATLTVTAANGVILSGTVPTGVDTDPDNDPLTVIGVTTGTAANTTAVGTANVASSLLGTYGHLTLASDGSYVYTADTAAADALGQGITATDVFSYAISDGNGGTAFTTLTITVTGTNDVPTVAGILPPVTQADSTAVNVPTVAGFTDLDSNNVFTYTASGLPTGLTINPATGAITGTLANNASQGGTAGVYSIVVTATDSQGIPVSQTFSFTATNPAPTANPDVNAVAENATLTVTAANGVILSGTVPAGVDTDPDNDLLTVIGVTTGTAANTAAVGTANVASSLLGTYGHLTLASDGSYVYTADTAAADALGQGITATDVFSYAISDGNGGTAFTTLTITVTGTNDVPTVAGILPPVTQADSTAVNVPTVAGFTDLDSNNVFTYTASGLPTGLTINPATGAITGTLANNASQGGTAGVYSIVVTATDSQGIPVSQTFSFTATNPAPTANPDVNAVAENATLTVTAANGVILSGIVPAGVDTDPDNDPLTVIGVTTGTAANTAAVGTANVASSLLGTYGHLTLASDGSYVYIADTAAADALGQGVTATDVFSYAISDGNGGTAFTTLTITVTGTNDNPVAIDDTNVTDKNVILTVPVATGVLSNDTDVDTGDTLTVGAVNGVAGNIGANVTGSNGGTFNIANDGSYTFDPGTDFNSLAPGATATTSVTYTAADNHGGTATATLTITVRGLNRNPVANADTGSLLENGVINASVTNGAIQSASVPAGKDTDPDGDTLSIIGVTTGTAPDVVSVGTANLGTALIGTYGTLTLNSDGSYSYAADHADALPAGVQATDTFSYAISDGRNGTSFTTLTFTITGVNDAPITIGNLAGVTQTDGTPVNIPTSTHFSDADGSLVYSATGLPSGLTINPVTGAIAGTLSNSASQGGTGGVYSITVTATDAEGAKVSQNFTFTALNSVPTAHNDTGSVTENANMTINASSGVISGAVPAGRDTDPNGDVLTVIGVRAGVASSASDVGTANIGSVVVGKYGILALNANGSYSYSADRADTLDAGARANDIFSYAISDGKGGTAFATLTIVVTGINDAPAPLGILPDVSKIDSTVVKIGTAANFTDPDSHNVFRYSAAGLPAGLSIDPATGLITGTLAANASQGGIAGIYTITVTATDSTGVVAVQHFNFTALPVANGVAVVPNTEVTPGSLILLNNPDKPGVSADYHELEKKDWHIEYKLKDDNNLPPIHLSLYDPLRHYVLSLTGDLRDQVVLELERYSFSVPRWMFRHTDPNAQLEFEAMRPDGSPLPEWLKFNPNTLKFYGLVPKCARNEVVMVVARDTYGNEVHPTFTVHVNRERVRPGQKPGTEINGSCGKLATGKSALSEQVHAVGKLSKLQESRALIHSLKQL